MITGEPSPAGRRATPLEALLGAVPGELHPHVVGDATAAVTAMTHESRLVTGGCLYACVRGDHVSPGYLGNAIGLPRRAHWLCPGDAGVRTDDGTIRFFGLLKPLFTRNGYNIYPR